MLADARALGKVERLSFTERLGEVDSDRPRWSGRMDLSPRLQDLGRTLRCPWRCAALSLLSKRSTRQGGAELSLGLETALAARAQLNIWSQDRRRSLDLQDQAKSKHKDRPRASLPTTFRRPPSFELELELSGPELPADIDYPVLDSPRMTQSRDA